MRWLLMLQDLLRIRPALRIAALGAALLLALASLPVQGASLDDSQEDRVNESLDEGSIEASAEASEKVEGTQALEPEFTGPVVDRIEWQGVAAFDEDELEARIVTAAQPWIQLRFWRPKRRLDEYVLEEDVNEIAEAYREEGYFAASVEAHVEPLGDDRVAVRFVVEEGPRASLEAWTLEIETAPEEEAPPTEEERAGLRRFVEFGPDEPFGSRLYRERRSALLEEAGELGFPFARISGGAQVDPMAAVARVDWTLDLGPRTYYGKIRITGLDDVDEEIVERELLFESGDRFSPSTLAESERQLVGLGLFRTVAIGRSGEARERDEGDEPAPSVEDRIDIEIHVEEAPPRSLRASIGYGTEDGPRGEIGLTWRNFTGQARRLEIRAFGSFLDAGVEASLGQPYVFGEWARGDLAFSALRQARPGYEAFVTGASGLLTLYPDRRKGPWSLSIGPGYEFAQILEFSIDIGDSLRGPRESVIVNWFTIARYQKVDDLLNPRSGFRFELKNEIGGFPIGSELDYHLWGIDVRAYQPMGPLVWAARIAASTLDPIGEGLSAVPLTRRLYSGGTNSVRGFGFQKLGPKDLGNDPIGGLSRMEAGIELRIPVWRRIGVVGFVDAGDVRLRTWSFRPKEVRASAGPGLRIATPIGPLRFDFGFLLNPPPDADPWRFHLSVGHAF